MSGTRVLFVSGPMLPHFEAWLRGERPWVTASDWPRDVQPYGVKPVARGDALHPAGDRAVYSVTSDEFDGDMLNGDWVPKFSVARMKDWPEL